MTHVEGNQCFSQRPRALQEPPKLLLSPKTPLHLLWPNDAIIWMPQKNKWQETRTLRCAPLECVHDPPPWSMQRLVLQRDRDCYPFNTVPTVWGWKSHQSIKDIRGVYSTFLSIGCLINMICSWENNTLLHQREIGSPNCETKEREPVMFIEVITNNLQKELQWQILFHSVLPILSLRRTFLRLCWVFSLPACRFRIWCRVQN